MTSKSQLTCKRLRAMGLRPEIAYPIMDKIQNWVESNGYEWSISRLKEMKTNAIRMLASEEPKWTWVAHNHQGLPKGPFKILFQWILSNDIRKASKALNVLMMYSEWVSNSLTEKQWKKFQSSVEQEVSLATELSCDAVSQIAANMGKKMRNHFLAEDSEILAFRKPKPLERIPFTSERRAPVYPRTVPESEVCTWLHGYFSTKREARRFNTYASLYEPVFQGFDRHNVDVRDLFTPSYNYGRNTRRLPEMVGRIGFIQEPGFKLRAVANPCRVHQAALDPLKNVLLDILRKVPQDCTHDQKAALPVIQDWLQQGLTVYSIDLSDATNNFPLSVQMAFARNLLGQEWEPSLKLFHELSRAPWVVKDPVKGLRRMRWTKGQPLGLGPSFPMFAMAHHAVVRMCAQRIGSNDPLYRIVGDDIVIADKELAEEYVNLMAAIGCPNSVDKTVTSSSIAEFAGKVITRQGVIHTYKWRDPSDRSFIDVAKQLGPQSKSLFRPRQRRILDLIASVPEELGGLGWNPKGLPLDERCVSDETLSLIENNRVQLIEFKDSERTLVSWLNQLAMMGVIRSETRQSLHLDSVTLKSQGSRPTRPSKSRLESILKSVGTDKEKLPEDVSPVRGYSPSVKAESDPRGSSTLSVMESKLKLNIERLVREKSLTTKAEDEELQDSVYQPSEPNF